MNKIKSLLAFVLVFSLTIPQITLPVFAEEVTGPKTYISNINKASNWENINATYAGDTKITAIPANGSNPAAIKISTPATSGQGNILVDKAAPKITNGEIIMTYRMDANPSNRVGLANRIVDSNNFNSVIWDISASSNILSSRYSGGTESYTSIGYVPRSGNFAKINDNGDRHTLRIIITNKTAEAYIDGTKFGGKSVSDLLTDSGSIGLRLWGETETIYVEDFRVISNDITIPSPYVSDITNASHWKNINPTYASNTNITAIPASGGNPAAIKVTGPGTDAAGNLIIDTSAPQVKNGRIEMTYRMDANTSNRVGLVIRAKDVANHNSVGWNMNGEFWTSIYQNNEEITWGGAGKTDATNAQGDRHKLSMDFNDKKLIVKIDGIEIYSGTNDELFSNWGQVGFRIWGASETIYIEDYRLFYNEIIDTTLEMIEPEEPDNLVTYISDISDPTRWVNINSAYAPATRISAFAGDGTNPAAVKIFGPGTSAAGNVLIDTKAPQVTNGEISVTFRMDPNPYNRFGVVFRTPNAAGKNSVGWDLDGKLWTSVYSDGSETTYFNMGSTNEKPLEDGSRHTFKFAFEDNNYTIKIDDVQVWSGTYQNFPIKPGQIGIRLRGSAGTIYIEDFRLTYNPDKQPSFVGLGTKAGAPEEELSLWYTEPGSDALNEGLPIGNGYMAALITGGIAKESVQFNEESLWTGGPGGTARYTNSSGSAPYDYGIYSGASNKIDEIYSDLKNGNYDTAVNKMGYLQGTENGYGAYQNFGYLDIDYRIEGNKTANEYRRELNLENGTAQVSYELDGVKYKREYFANYPDHVMAMKITADQAGKLNLGVSASSAQTNALDASITASNGIVTMKGKLKDNGMRYEAQFKVINEGGALSSSGDKVNVEGANSVIILYSAATDYKNEFTGIESSTYRNGIDPHEPVTQRIEAAASKGYDALLSAHKADYQELFGRVDLNIGNTKSTVPTNEMINAYKANQKDSIARMAEVLLYQYGRYLLISSSREGTLPANLQGKWNNANNPPWSSDYHYNINLQMNYWPAESANLAETALPLIDFVKSIVPTGRIGAEKYFGIKDGGWTVHTSGNIFGLAAPGWSWSWGWSPANNAFISQNLWDYYTFTRDKAMLENEIYPVMREAALFWTKALREDTDGTLVAAPGYSPEHGPLSYGIAYDQQLIWELFTNVIKASEDLGTDAEFRNKLIEMRGKLSPIQIGTYGQIQEWKNNPTDSGSGVETNHRHVSQLVGLYPGTQINSNTKDLLDAAKVTLTRRGDEATGWSMGWKINFWARALDGDHAHTLMKSLITSKLARNLFDLHPPFQIDGNFGYAAGVNEVLLQSHLDTIDLLPALPTAWSTGYVSGIRARGAYEVDMEWADKTLNTAKVTPDESGECKVRYSLFDEKKVIVKLDGANVAYVKDGETIKFDAQAGKTYIITMTVPDVTYTITAESGTGGTIEPTGAITVVKGDNQTFAITPNEGFEIAEVLVDGASVEVTENSYLFENVTANHSISISFIEIPKITKQPQDSTVAVGDEVSLQVEAAVSDGGEISYQWYETATDETAGNSIDGATDSAFIPPTNEEGTFKYYVVVTNTKGNSTASVTSEIATVTVSNTASETAATPEITKQPADVTANLNGTVELSVEATAGDGGTLSYQWYEENDPDTVLSTSETFNPPTDTEGTRNYYVVITNTKDGKTASVTSAIASVTVSEELPVSPVITKQPDSVAVNLGERATLEVVANVSDDGEISYQWYRTIIDETTGIPIEGATSSTFNPPTNKAGENIYYCVVTNEKDGKTASTTSKVARVTVNPLNPPISYTIRYDANYGSGTMNSVNVANGANYTLLSNSFSHGNYNFIGWSTSRSGGAILQPGDTIYNVKSNMVFYAQWEYIGSRDNDNNSNNSGSNSNSNSSGNSSGNSGTSSSTTPATTPATTDSGTKNVGKPVDDGTKDIKPDKIPAGNPNTEKEKDYPKLTNDKDKGYISGYEDKTFKPNKGVTRYEVSSIIFRLLENPNAHDTKQATVYNDVEYSQWYGKAVTTLSALGILHGYEDGTFRGEKTITRAEFITVLSLIHPLKEGGKISYGDVSEDAWYYKHLQSAISYGWVSGYQDGTFRPNQPITRAEAVVILNRVLGIKADDKTATNEFSDVPETFWARNEIIAAAGFFNK